MTAANRILVIIVVFFICREQAFDKIQTWISHSITGNTRSTSSLSRKLEALSVNMLTLEL